MSQNKKNIQELVTIVDELVQWAKSVERTEVSANITLTPNSIFTEAKRLVDKHKLKP